MTIEDLKALLDRIPNDNPINRARRSEIRKLIRQLQKGETV